MSKIENNVINKIKSRAEIGEKKYGVTMERQDLTSDEWITHMQEELLDGAVYCEKLLTGNPIKEEEFGKLKMIKYGILFIYGAIQFWFWIAITIGLVVVIYSHLFTDVYDMPELVGLMFPVYFIWTNNLILKIRKNKE